MDQDIIKIEKVVVSGEMPPTPAEEALEEPYIPLLKPDTPAASIIQPYQHENLQCFQCFITFCNSKAKERHMKKSHREEYKQQLQQCDTLFTCYVCDRTFLSSEELTQHQGSHNKEDKPFKCSHCQESFRTFSELTSHRRQVCPERQFICRDCGETFRGPALLRSHRLAQHPPRHEDMSVTDETKTHRCGKCGRGFEAETELLQHQENHAGDQHCNGSTPTKRRGRPPKAECVMHGKGKRVKKDESGLKLSDAQLPFVGKGDVVGFPGQAQKVSMAEQDEVEGKEETSAAPPASLHPCKDCKLSFSTGAQLRAHKKEKHSRSLARKPFACGECEESFPRPEQLESHVARAHSAGRYCCPQCGKSFGRESNLKAHRLVHSEERKVKDGCNR